MTFRSVVASVSFALMVLGVSGSSAHARPDTHFRGALAERYSDSQFLKSSAYQPDKWEKINGQIGRTGFDGLYVRRKNGVIRKVFINESKYGYSKLGTTRAGKQMSKQWSIKKVDELLSRARAEHLTAGTASRRLVGARRIADLEQIKRLLIADTGVRRQVWNHKFSGGRWHIQKNVVADELAENLVRGKFGGELDKGIILEDRQFDRLEKASSRRFHQREREKVFTSLRRELQKDSLSSRQTNKVIQELKSGKLNDMQTLSARRATLMRRNLWIGLPMATVVSGRRHVALSLSSLKGNIKSIRLVSTLRVVPWALYAYEGLQGYRSTMKWVTGKVSNRELFRKLATVAGGITGAAVGQKLGALGGRAVGTALQSTQGMVGADNAGSFIGRAVGGVVGWGVGRALAGNAAESYLDLLDDRAKQEYKNFLQDHLRQASANGSLT